MLEFYFTTAFTTLLYSTCIKWDFFPVQSQESKNFITSNTIPLLSVYDKLKYKLKKCGDGFRRDFLVRFGTRNLISCPQMCIPALRLKTCPIHTCSPLPWSAAWRQGSICADATCAASQEYRSARARAGSGGVSGAAVVFEREVQGYWGDSEMAPPPPKTQQSAGAVQAGWEGEVERSEVSGHEC